MDEIDTFLKTDICNQKSTKFSPSNCTIPLQVMIQTVNAFTDDHSLTLVVDVVDL